jgi:PKD repeat protein
MNRTTVRTRASRLLACCFALALAGAAWAPAARAQGASATVVNPTARFNSPGVKQVSLTVCNSSGCDSTQRVVNVLDPLPRILTLPAVPARLGAGQTMSLLATTAGRPPLNHRWVVARTGSPSLFLPGNPALLSTANLALGSYQVKLELDNVDGSTVSSNLPLDVVRMTFADVPPSLGVWQFVETIFDRGVTSGCGGLPVRYCPDGSVTREQMSVFLLRAKEGPAYLPPPCLTQVFADVPCTNPFAAWINELAAREVTGGCGNGNYCPTAKTSRGQMAVFLLRAKEGPAYTPPACTVAMFADMPCSDPFAPWVNEIAARGISSGCGGGNFCPAGLVSRGSMAVFLTVNFTLPTPQLL